MLSSFSEVALVTHSGIGGEGEGLRIFRQKVEASCLRECVGVESFLAITLHFLQAHKMLSQVFCTLCLESG